MYKKILVALDKSENSQNAIEHAKMVAKNFNAKIILFCAYQVSSDLLDQQIMYNLENNYIQKMTDNLKKHYQDFLDETKKKISAQEIEVSTLLENGKTGVKIVEAIESTQSDIAIIGSRGLGNLSSMVMGSVSSYVLHHTNKPLLIVK
ncbi:universal stress protein [Candidatus Uabimicrobium sp. HlEnr_7]|uniref:universal stress protein n=1 Tax=Candidatus Uabimicrobium helgolandensis TaxID=3095367 RepID=UPI003556A21B